MKSLCRFAVAFLVVSVLGVPSVSFAVGEYLLREDHPSYVENFSSLGPMYQVEGLVWSSPVAEDVNLRFGGGWFRLSHDIRQGKMNFRAAVAYCEGVGGKLPTPEDFADLARAKRRVSTQGGASFDLFPNSATREFWTSSGHSTAAPGDLLSVRCVSVL